MGCPWFLWATCFRTSPPSQQINSSSSKFVFLQLKTIPPYPITMGPRKKSLCSSLLALIRHWKVFEGLPEAFSSPSWTKATLSSFRGEMLQFSEHPLPWTRSKRFITFLFCGLHSWTQHSRWDLTRAEQRGKIPSLTLLAILLCVQPRIHLAFLSASARCQLVSTFLPTNIPKCSGLLSAHSSVQPVFVLGVVSTDMQDLAFGFVELHEVHIVPLPKPAKVPLDGILALQHLNCNTQLCVFGKLACYLSVLMAKSLFALNHQQPLWLLSISQFSVGSAKINK